MHTCLSTGYPGGERKQIPLFSNRALRTGSRYRGPDAGGPFQLKGGIQ
jgi:hypothetical protein